MQLVTGSGVVPMGSGLAFLTQSGFVHSRLIFSLQPIFFGALGLVPKIHAREKRRQEEPCVGRADADSLRTQKLCEWHPVNSDTGFYVSKSYGSYKTFW